ncbi:hypothetical protein [Streptomyces sp. V2I9]|uniref:hypothetical protein n=1 Tax=Streptomyces sp. V2I9 TaxID=3042304 RepID=UPI00277DCFAA|nr:hypothetical protein [Streptomyces sp. V2I9]MDQ0986990.1 hypothetical protein [Streptomyces sp. V2I9]
MTIHTAWSKSPMLAAPLPTQAGEDDECGRGLLLVAALSEETGHHDRHPIGKTVWARLILSSPSKESVCTS